MKIQKGTATNWCSMLRHYKELGTASILMATRVPPLKTWRYIQT